MIETLATLMSVMKAKGANRILAKKLSANDNSKNQIYLGGGFSALQIIPHGRVFVDDKQRYGSVGPRSKANIDFHWLVDEELHCAPGAQLILYPNYPEVRLSGLLRECPNAPSDLISSRIEGRILFLGITDDDKILGFVSGPESEIAVSFNSSSEPVTGVFSDLNDSLGELMGKLKGIVNRWIKSQKLSAEGISKEYSAPNGGGYTLEAELGIYPNGRAGPDFLGWEIKQFAVNNFSKYRAKSAVTLFTPEPKIGTGEKGEFEEFIRAYGYEDKSGRANRLNFGGIYRAGKDYHQDTGLKLIIDGYDDQTNTITNMEGCIALSNKKDEIVLSWSLLKLMDLWCHKHAKAVYVPSIKKAGSPPMYRYGSRISLHQKTEFHYFLKNLSAGKIYYDPGIKMQEMENYTVKKRRSQFRIAHKDLDGLYEKNETLEL